MAQLVACWILISPQVTISGMWDPVQHWAMLLGILSLSLCSSPTHSREKKNVNPRTLSLQERDTKSLEAKCPLKCARELNSVSPNPSVRPAHVSAFLHDQPTSEWCRTESTHLSLNYHSGSKAASLHCLEGCQIFAPGSNPAAYLNLGSAMDNYFLDADLTLHSQLGPWTNGSWLCSRQCFVETCQRRCFGTLSFNLCWTFLSQLSWCGHLQSCHHAVETLTFFT